MTAKKILITPRSFKQAGDAPHNLLSSNGFEIVENDSGKTLSEDQMLELCADVDGLLVGIDPITDRVLKHAKKLKAISKYGAGLDNIDISAAKELGIEVRRAAGTNATSVAELAISMFFALARSIVPVACGNKKSEWTRVRGVELAGKTAGIVGLGYVGREVARIAHGLNMNILGYDPFIDPQEPLLAKNDVTLASLDAVIQNADFLTLHLPLTPETKHMMNGTTLKTMKPSAYLINTSRGELVDENSLYEALSKGWIAGAAADVFSKEPPDAQPLLQLDNFILTSHIGAYTAEANLRMAMVSAQNLLDMLS